MASGLVKDQSDNTRQEGKEQVDADTRNSKVRIKVARSGNQDADWEGCEEQ